MSLVWGDHKIPTCRNGGDHKIPGPLDRGDHKISRVNFAQFFSPPPPVVNVTSLNAKDNNPKEPPPLYVDMAHLTTYHLST